MTTHTHTTQTHHHQATHTIPHTSSSSHSVSVIICCYTEERLHDIREAVASVQRQTHPPKEIILAVDNNPILFERLRSEFSHPIRAVLNDKIRGLSATRNTGILAARGELIAFLDDDAVADPEWLDRLTTAFRDPNVMAAGGKTVLNWAGGRPFWFPDELDWLVGGSYRGMPERRAQVRNPHGGNMCFRRSAFDVSGLFDPRAGRVGSGTQAGEEVEFCLRLRRTLPAARILYEPLAVIVHKVPRSRMTFRYLVRRSFGEGVSKGRIVRNCGFADFEALATERTYLRTMLVSALPSRFARLWSWEATLQTLAIIVSTAATAAGYAWALFALGDLGRRENRRR